MKMKDKVKKLENRMKIMNRVHRKLNIVVKGIDPKTKLENRTVQNFLAEKIGVDAKINDVEKIDINKNNEMTAKVDCWESKELIMRNKNKIKRIN